MKPQSEVVAIAKALQAQLGIPVARGNVWVGIEDDQPVIILEIEPGVLRNLASKIPASLSGVRVVVRDRFTPIAQRSEAVH